MDGSYQQIRARAFLKVRLIFHFLRFRFVKVSFNGCFKPTTYKADHSSNTKAYITKFSKYLLGEQGPCFKEKSSIAMSPVKLLPRTPSNVTCLYIYEMHIEKTNVIQFRNNK